MNDIYHRIIRRCKCSKCKHSTVLASKSQLDSRDLTSFFVSATRSGTCIANEYDLVAHGWHRSGHIVHRSSPVWVDRWEFWHTWKSSHSNSHCHVYSSPFPFQFLVYLCSRSHAHLLFTVAYLPFCTHSTHTCLWAGHGSYYTAHWG